MRLPLAGSIDSGLAVAQFAGLRPFESPLAPPLEARPDSWSRAPSLAKVAASTAGASSSIFLSGWLPNFVVPGASQYAQYASADVPALSAADEYDLWMVALTISLIAQAEGVSSGLLWAPVRATERAPWVPHELADGYDFLGQGSPMPF